MKIWPFLAIFGHFSGISAIFGLGPKVRPFLEMAYRARSNGPFGFLIGGHFWAKNGQKWPKIGQKWPKIGQKGHFEPYRPFLA